MEDILSPSGQPQSKDNVSGRHDIEEVSNYVKAMNQGLEKLNELPLCTRLIKEIHATLMTGVRGSNKTPGEFRKSQNWIGHPGANLKTAQYVPPPFEDVDRLMSELEKFIHADNYMPPLIKAALIHAQFETIHPFLDGNGRLGRLLITYLLCFWNVMDRPLLYISYYLKAHRSEYYTRLMDVRTKGDWEGWVKFFLRAVSESADTANAAAIEIYQLHNADRDLIQKNKVSAYVLKVFNEFCHNPILDTTNLVEKHKSTRPKAQRAIEYLLNLGIISEISGKQRNRKYAYHKYLQILVRDTTMRAG